jgi:IS5 family transposase
MRPRERRETGEQDLFRSSRLDQIIDMNHPLVRLARAVDWPFLEARFGEVYTDGAGQPPLPTRLMAGLAILKHTYDLSDEVLCERWVENPYYQYFCGEEFFQHQLVFDRSSITRWRNRMGEERLQALLQESLSVATKTGAIKPSELSRVIVDTTVQPKNVMFPTDARLLNRAREKLVRLAKLRGVTLRQSYARVGKIALIQHQRYAHAKQFKRAKMMLRTLRTYLGRVIRDITARSRAIAGTKHPSHRCSCWRDACTSNSSASADPRPTRCTPRRSSASAKVRPIGPTSSASRSPSRPPSATPRAAGSSPM